MEKTGTLGPNGPQGAEKSETDQIKRKPGEGRKSLRDSGIVSCSQTFDEEVIVKTPEDAERVTRRAQLQRERNERAMIWRDRIPQVGAVLTEDDEGDLNEEELRRCSTEAQAGSQKQDE